MGANTTTSTTPSGGTQTTTRGPWAPAEGPIQNAWQWAGGLFDQGINNPHPASYDTGLQMQADTASRLAPLAENAYTKAANFDPFGNTTINNSIANLQDYWQHPMPEASAAAFNALQNSGVYGNPATNQVEGWTKDYGVPIGQAQDLTNRALNQPLAAENNLAGLAANTTGALTPTQQAILDQNAERIGNRQASLYNGAGRLGSFGAGLGTARGIAETNNPLIAQFNQQGIQNSLNANQQMTQSTLGRYGVGANAIGQQGGLMTQRGGQMLAANAQQQEAQVAAVNAALQGRQQQIQAQNAALQAGVQLQGQGLQNQGQLPGLFAGAMMPGQAMQGVGSEQMSLPWQFLKNYEGGLTGVSPLLGGAGTSSGINNNLSTTTQSTPTPWTTFAGLGLAGAGLLSDKRLKTDITKLGKDRESDLPVYAFRYKGDPKSYPKMVGPMAQDVQKKYPWMVAKIGRDGPLYIKA